MSLTEKYEAALREETSAAAAVKRLAEEIPTTPEAVIEALVKQGMDRRRFNGVLGKLKKAPDVPEGFTVWDPNGVSEPSGNHSEPFLPDNGNAADDNGTRAVSEACGFASETGQPEAEKKERREPARQDADEERELLTVGWLIRSMDMPDNVREKKLIIRIRALDHEGEITISGKSWLLPVAEQLTVESWSPSWDKPGELWIQVVPPGGGEA